jgi:hypothetical protein
MPVVALKFGLHQLDWEVITLGTLHGGVVTGTFFVVGFLLSATISDYKESERMVPEFSSVLENMHEDGQAIRTVYPKFKFQAFQRQLRDVAESFADDVRNKDFGSRLKLHELNKSFISMEKAGVPANFIVKLKQQQSQLLRILSRVSYIQNIRFIPSATILVRTIIPLTIGLLVFTEIEPFYGGMAIVAIITLILIYILQLIQSISTPFQQAGKTKDDISLFLIDQAADHLRKQ